METVSKHAGTAPIRLFNLGTLIQPAIIAPELSITGKSVGGFIIV